MLAYLRRTHVQRARNHVSEAMVKFQNVTLISFFTLSENVHKLFGNCQGLTETSSFVRFTFPKTVENRLSRLLAWHSVLATSARRD